jgi:hypothetical protein
MPTSLAMAELDVKCGPHTDETKVSDSIVGIACNVRIPGRILIGDGSLGRLRLRAGVLASLGQSPYGLNEAGLFQKRLLADYSMQNKI